MQGRVHKSTSFLGDPSGLITVMPRLERNTMRGDYSYCPFLSMISIFQSPVTRIVVLLPGQ